LRAISEDLAAAYPAADPALFNIGLLHTSLDGREGHATYAPTSARILAQKGYQYWALGHVHRREVVSKDPWIVFPGNLQGRHARELGAKGCTLVSVENGAVVEVEERPVDVLRWSLCRVDVDGATTTNEVLDRIAHALTVEADRADGRALAVRVEVTGPVACHDEIVADPDHWIQEIRALAIGVSSADVWVEQVRFAMNRPTDLAALAGRDDAVGSLLRELSITADRPDEVEALREALADIRGALPPELLSGDNAVDPRSPDLLARLVGEARELLLAKITREGVKP
jgi:DNA repair exonuclease SbcCD nuclease subunit